MTMSVTRETQVTHKEIPVVIRADITYFRQDFSVMQLVGPGAEPLRFDFLVRTRPVTSEEMRLLKKRPELHPALRQKESVLFALRELTGKDPGRTLEDWLALFPEAGDEVEAARLCQEFVRATPDKQPGLLARLKDQPGAAGTQALAEAIPQLPEEMRVQVRKALTERLTRLPPSALRDKLAEDDPEVRRAAALACAKKEDRSLIPDLIGLLDDGDVQVGRVARSTLKTMTGRDHADPSAWRSWLSGEGGE
jgi:hypothetical protein